MAAGTRGDPQGPVDARGVQIYVEAPTGFTMSLQSKLIQMEPR